MIYIKNYPSPLGGLVLAEKDCQLAGLWIEGQKYCLSTLKNKDVQKSDTPFLRQVCRWLEQYFSGQMPGISQIPLAPEGTGFQKSVWKLLCEIPYGQTTTYGDIAKRMTYGPQPPAGALPGRMSARAVGNAVSRNPISIIIPCHRVVGAKGNLTGYAGGLDKKIWLLTHERAMQTRQPEPGASRPGYGDARKTNAATLPQTRLL